LNQVKTSVEQSIRSKTKGIGSINLASSIRKVFSSLDNDGNGVLDSDEFRTGLRRLGCDLEMNVLERVMHLFDKDGDGTYKSERCEQCSRSNVALIIVSIVYISSFLFYCLLLNHSFSTNSNKITNCFYLFSLLIEFPII
jgi:hypothetical protein